MSAWSRKSRVVPSTGWCLAILISFCGFSTRAWAGLDVWTSLGPKGGVIWSLDEDPTDPQTLYAGTEGGVFKSDDRGFHWRSVLRNRNVALVVTHPSVPGTVLAAATGLGGLFRSDDGGESWRDITDDSGSRYVLSLAFDPRAGDTIYAGVPSGVLKTEDGGENWGPTGPGIP